MVPRLFYIARFITASLFIAGVALYASAATNVATDPGGGVTMLNSSNVITINSLQVTLVKEARSLAGDILPDSMSLAAGTRFYFVLYLDNTTDTPISDVTILDTVPSGSGGFTVDNTTFEILNEAGPGIDMTAANDTAWNGNATWLALTWDPQSIIAGPGDDYLDWNVTTPDTLTVGSAGVSANRQLDVPVSGEVDKLANPRRVAVRFQATLNP